MAIAPSQAPAKSESNDFAPAQQIMCHDSEKHGQLTKEDKLALSTANSINENVLLQHTSSEAPEFDAFRGMKRPSRFRCCNFTIRRVVDISDKLCQYQESAGRIAQSTQPMKTTLPKSCTIRIFEHFRSIVDDSTPCFFSCDVWRLSLFRIQSKSVS